MNLHFINALRFSSIKLYSIDGRVCCLHRLHSLTHTRSLHEWSERAELLQCSYNPIWRVCCFFRKSSALASLLPCERKITSTTINVFNFVAFGTYVHYCQRRTEKNSICIPRKCSLVTCVKLFPIFDTDSIAVVFRRLLFLVLVGYYRKLKVVNCSTLGPHSVPERQFIPNNIQCN